MRNCVASLRRHEKGSNYEIIVVDDGSPEIEQKKLTLLFERYVGFPVQVILNKQNKGFSATVNTGLQRAKGNYLTLVNNDIIFYQPIFEEIEAEFLRDAEYYPVGIVGGTLFYPNGKVQHSGLRYSPNSNAFLDPLKHTLFKNRWYSHFSIAVTGALFSISKELVAAIGVFDEKFFVAAEDTDYCIRAWDAKYAVVASTLVQAYHHEGATRGASDRIKRTKFSKWFEKEQASIAYFKQKWKGYDFQILQSEIDNMKITETKKLEVGSGHNPQPGYVHLDVRPGLPSLDKVCDFEKKKLPFPDNSFTEVLGNHVIEHISWRRLPHVVSEWARVLVPGGKLVLRTPDLYFIINRCLGGETTPEHPRDESFIKEHLTGGEITPGWWANLKLFSGQDYDANFHKVCFSFEMLADLLYRYGFTNVKREKFDVTYSPGELQVVATKAKGKVLVKRAGAFGDVLLTTPIVERLLKEDWTVEVLTACGDVYAKHPRVRVVKFTGPQSLLEKRYERVIDLDLAYERSPKQHIIDAYSMVAFGDTQTKHELSFNFNSGESFTELPYTVVHAGVGWPNRTWPREKWEQLIKTLESPGYTKVVTIGKGSDHSFENLGVKHYRDYPIQDIAGLIANAEMFIGMDSGMLHLAQAIGTPAVGIFTCAKAEYRTTGALSVIPNIECYGCLHNEEPPVTFCGCKRGDYKCLDLITPDMVMNKVIEAMKI